MTITAARAVDGTVDGAVDQPGRHLAVRLRLAEPLALVTVAAALATLLVPDLLTGTAVMNGSARGTALVALVVGAPALTLAARLARRGSVRALAVTTGVSAYLVYNAVMFLFGTPFNPAFPLYVAMLGLGVATVVSAGLGLAEDLDGLEVAGPRWVAVYIWVVVALNTAAWLRSVLPALVADQPTEWLRGSGLTTSPVIAQDLAVWLPLMAWLAWACGATAPSRSGWPPRAPFSGSSSRPEWPSTRRGGTPPTLRPRGPRPGRSRCSRPSRWWEPSRR